jgi:dTDP-4-dehydrorhamnose reductase
MRILLTGASGLVGSAVARRAGAAGHAVVGVVGRFAGEIQGLTERLVLDLADADAVRRTVRTVHPDVIVNAAAISEPAKCDLDPVRSAALNVALPARLGELAREVGARLLHISSEQVFDGTRTVPYGVLDSTCPINRYGRQKLESERQVLGAGAAAAVVRAPLLLGDSPGRHRGVHERLLSDWAANRPARLYVDEFRQPCSGDDLAVVLLALAERPELCGVYHWAGAELLSRFDLGCRIREHFGLRPAVAPIVPVRRADTPDVSAGRQACLALDLAPLPTELKLAPPTIASQLAALTVPDSARAGYEAMRTTAHPGVPGEASRLGIRG